MSLKVIEMQIALPRTQDAGKVQEQIQQRSQVQQDHAIQEEQQEAEKKLHSVVKEERKPSVHLNEKEGNPDKGPFTNNKKKKKEKKKHSTSSQHHPFKGNVIDYSG